MWLETLINLEGIGGGSHEDRGHEMYRMKAC
jgi:hypothetical protein